MSRGICQRAMLLRHIEHEARVHAHRPNLRAVADDAGVFGQPVPKVVGLEREPRRLEAEKSLLEAGPFGFDHAPGEAGREHALGHLGEHAVVLKLAQRFGVRFRRQKASERFSAAFALLGSGADGFERDHPGDPLVLKPFQTRRGRFRTQSALRPLGSHEICLGPAGENS